ncbi:PDR/VanB family oxidoreductase [uncultured Roseobacter sp.]|uniref:PDR/VanB family oxidoreductase n=1 Tax=uncultured Roseobacter sp. TaxID=114847 RepID=UPI00260A63A5|nr:PDR/VanB family oxidoreductase [uncultured Roseobacter sp.]
MALINVKVAKISQEATGIKSFLLAKKGLFKLPAYRPGAHIDVHCGEGIIRQYSLCGDPVDRRHFTIAVKKGEPSRGGSDLMHMTVREGDILEVGAPRNSFPLDETANHALLLAAGIGITPIIAMADRLSVLGRSFALHYFSRGCDHTAFRDRLENGKYKQHVTFHEGLDVPATSAALRKLLSRPVPHGQVYICGPAPFMDTAEICAMENWPTDAINLERFAANPAISGAPTSPFTVKLARTGVTLEVAADETILDVLDANGIDAAFSCEQGVCGTCVTDIVDGTPDHRDSFLTERQRASGNQMCLCVSRARGESIVLNL